MRRLFDSLYGPCAALILVLLIPPVCLLVIAGPTLAVRRETGRLCVRLMLAAIGVPMRVRGLEQLPPGRNLVICNHASYLDGIVLTAVLPRHYSFVVQDGAAGWPLIGLCLSRMGVIYVNRQDSRAGANTTRALMRRLHAGEALAVFAEGTFKPEPGLLPFKMGAFLMAARCGAPVVPAAIRGSRQLYGGHRKLPRWQPLEVELAAAIHPQGGDHRSEALRLRDLARREVLRLCEEPDLQGSAADRVEEAA